MSQLTFERFLLSQPSYPRVQPTDKYYYGVCLKLIELTATSHLLDEYHPSVVERAMLALTGYYQDIICDAGLWRAFINRNRALYNRTLPFYDTSDEYMDYELNPEDVTFMIWYATSMLSDKQRFTSPCDHGILQLSKILFDYLERIYDESPMPEGYCFGRELELHDPDDAETLYNLGHWLFMHSWLLTPAFALTLAEMVASIDESDMDALRKKMEQAMSSEPTGPLALYLNEWVRLVAEGKMPKSKQTQPEVVIHKYYKQFVAATGGATVAFFRDYDALNTFLKHSMGWDKSVDHLEQVRDLGYFTLMVTEEKGLLVAPETARSIAAPENPWYDAEYARDHAFALLTQRGRCPADLLRRCIKEQWLPDASFPGTDDRRIVATNADFVARCYLQKYYRAD